MEAVNDWFDSNIAPTEMNEAEQERFYEDIFQVCINVLRKLDKAGVFGVGEEREKVVVNILMGDQSDKERLSNASLLNPPKAFQILKDDLEELDRLYRRRNP